MMKKAEHAWALLGELIRLERPRLNQMTARTGLSQIELAALKATLESEGPLPMQELCGFWDKSSVTRAVQRLVKRGLVERRENPSDRRSKLVFLTPEGRVVADEVLREVLRPPASFTAMSEAELETFAGLLERVIAASHNRREDG